MSIFSKALSSPVVKTGLSIIPGVGQYLGAKEAADTSLASAREQMAFQERMSNTSHQREVEDLRKAGLNPYLTESYGGSSTPVGASYSMDQNPYSGFGELVPKLISIASAKQGLEEAQTRIDINKNTANKIKTETDILRPQANVSSLLDFGINKFKSTARQVLKSKLIKRTLNDVKDWFNNERSGTDYITTETQKRLSNSALELMRSKKRKSMVPYNTPFTGQY